jgi:hypothetical protein
MHTAESLISESISFEIEVAVEKLRDINHQVFIKFWQT